MLSKNTEYTIVTMSHDPRDVLPVPPELRDHIYDYLLATHQGQRETTPPANPSPGFRHSADHRYGSGAHTYEIDTAILRLNHATQDEALSRLHKSNTFVKVTYNCLGLTEMLHRCSVPMVCDDTAICQQLSYFSMEVKVTSTIDWSEECVRTDTCFVMAAQDLPILCQSLQALFLGCVNRRETYLPLQDGRVREFDMSQGEVPALLTFHLHDTKYKKMTAALEHYLLRPFIDFAFIASSCRVTGSLRDPDQVVEIEDYIGTRKVWLNAWIWRCLDVIQQGFTQALSLLHAGHNEAAECFVETVLDVDPRPHTRIISANFDDITMELKQCTARYFVAVLDIAAVGLVAYLRKGNYNLATVAGNSDVLEAYKCLIDLAGRRGGCIVLRPFEQNTDPERAAGVHPDYFWSHALLDLLFLDEQTDERWEKHISNLAGVVKLYPEKQYIMHDLKVLETVYNESKVNNTSPWQGMTNAEKVQKLSVMQFDKLNLGTPGHEDFAITDGINGFIDVEKSKALQEGRLTVIH